MYVCKYVVKTFRKSAEVVFAARSGRRRLCTDSSFACPSGAMGLDTRQVVTVTPLSYTYIHTYIHTYTLT